MNAGSLSTVSRTSEQEDQPVWLFYKMAVREIQDFLNVLSGQGTLLSVVKIVVASALACVRTFKNMLS